MVGTRVARWHIFKPKNPNLGKSLQWKMFILWPFGQLFGPLVYDVAIWYIL
jgi:hypothetical protein